MHQNSLNIFLSDAGDRQDKQTNRQTQSHRLSSSAEVTIVGNSPLLMARVTRRRRGHHSDV